MRRHRLGGQQRVAQPVKAVDQGHDARAGAHAVGGDALRETGAVSVLVVLGNDEQGPQASAHRLAERNALGDVLLVGLQLSISEAVIAVTQARGDVDLANIVQQRANAEDPSSRRAPGRRRGPSSRAMMPTLSEWAVCRSPAASFQQAQVEVALDQHLVEHGGGQRLSLLAAWLGQVETASTTWRNAAATFAVLLLAQRQRVPRCARRARACGLHGRGRRAWVGWAGRPGPARWLQPSQPWTSPESRDRSWLAPAHLGQAEPAQSDKLVT